MDKSYVGMGFELCPICGAKHTETVLLHKRMANVLEHENFTGFSLCPDHEKMRGEYLALVELTGDSFPPDISKVDAYNRRTGNFAHVRRTVAPKIFNVEIPAGQAFVFVEVGVLEKLEKMTPGGK